MGALLKLAIIIYICCLCFGCLCAVFKFLRDVAKWHDKEDKVNILPSRIYAEELEREEVLNYAGRDYGTGTGTGTGDNDGTGTGDNDNDGRGDGRGDNNYNYHTNAVIRF